MRLSGPPSLFDAPAYWDHEAQQSMQVKQPQREELETSQVDLEVWDQPPAATVAPTFSSFRGSAAAAPISQWSATPSRPSSFGSAYAYPSTAHFTPLRDHRAHSPYPSSFACGHGGAAAAAASVSHAPSIAVPATPAASMAKLMEPEEVERWRRHEDMKKKKQKEQEMRKRFGF
jgi:hypothetical protein